MVCSTQRIASTGDSPQFIGQVESTSTMLKPLFSICILSAFLIARFAAARRGTVWTETRVT